jgi:hypothetical protein
MYAIVFKDQLGVLGSGLAAAQAKCDAINELMGYDWAKKCSHVNFGMVYSQVL